MDDRKKTKAQLIAELEELRKLNTEPEKSNDTINQNDTLLFETELNYKSIFDLTYDGLSIWVRDKGSNEQRLIECNEAYAKLAGRSKEEMLSAPDIRKFYKHSTSEKKLWKIQEQLEKGKNITGELSWNRPDGSENYIEFKAVPFEVGDRIFVVGIDRDITERKKTEEALRDSEDFLNRTGDMAKVGGWQLDLKTRKVYWTRTTSRIHELPDDYEPDLDEAINYYHPDDREIVRESVNRAIESGKPYTIETRLITAKGRQRWVRAIGQPTLDAGKCVRLSGTFQDITERKRSENLINVQRDLSIKLSRVSGLDEGIRICIDTALHISDMDCGGIYLRNENSGALDLIYNKGLPPDFIKSASHYDADSQSTKLVMAGKPVYSKHQKLGLPIDGLRKKEHLYAIAVIPITHKDLVIGCMNIASHIINEVPEYSRIVLETIASQIGSEIIRLKAEEELRESNEIFSWFMEYSPIYVFFKDKYIRSLRLSRNFEQMLGQPIDELLDKTMDELFPSDFAKKMVADDKRVLEEGKPVTIEEEFNERCYETIKFPIFIDNERKYLAGFTIDITERKQLEEERAKASKLESIGILAGGIAHDFNNILATILGNISLAKMCLDTKSEAEELLSEVEKASLRARDLTNQLLTFSKGGAPVKELSELPELIKETVQFSLRGSNIRYQTTIPSNLWPADIDKGQFSQAISNVVINAQQAMPEGGTIYIITENACVTSEDGLPLKNGDYIKISIKDNGHGIPTKHVSKIFDPYFTTKQKGSGLGLATTHSIIHRHDGHIAVDSEDGLGTTFHIYLPATSHHIKEKEAVKDDTTVTTGKILVMDDDESVRKFVMKVLNGCGHEVETAADGTETITVYKNAMNSDKPFDGVIIDLTIPGGMGGKEAIQKLLKIDPDVKAVVSSGYANDPVVADYSDFGFINCLSKPYRLNDLKKVINKLLSNKN